MPNGLRPRIGAGHLAPSGRKSLSSQLEADWGQASISPHIADIRTSPIRTITSSNVEISLPAMLYVQSHYEWPRQSCAALSPSIPHQARGRSRQFWTTQGSVCFLSTPSWAARRSPALLVKLPQDGDSFFSGECGIQEQLGKPRRAVQPCQHGAHWLRWADRGHAGKDKRSSGSITTRRNATA